VETDGNLDTLSGNSSFINFRVWKRFADAINASQRQVLTFLHEDFKPWMVASAGNEFNAGQVIVRRPTATSEFLELVVPALTGDFDVFANNVRRAGDESVSASANLFPSRILISYPNYPEIFDNPTSVIDTQSDSAIDINSADGQEITAIIPFFGDSAFGGAQKSGIVVVFKTNSIYLVDLAAKAAGTQAVQKLETRGKGCTAPYSVSVTKGGIMFANESGIYRLNRNLSIDYIGRRYERLFNASTNLDNIDLFTGHHDTIDNSYKLSYVSSGESENSQVAVYNHTREYEGQGDGSWTTYNNHPATGWANLLSNNYFASTSGRVFSLRKVGDATDYRDDSSPVSFTAVTRPMDFGMSGIRKTIRNIITHYRVENTVEGTVMRTALDLNSTFDQTDSFILNQNQATSGLGDENTKKVLSIRTTLDRKTGVYVQLKYENSTIDESLEIAGIDFRVGARNTKGITEAADTSS
jgi:hypothetical protein